MTSIRLLVAFLGLAFSAVFASAEATAYRLQPLDEIGITVYQEEEDLDKKTVITQAGEAAFTFIGSVKLAGLTLEEAELKITEAYLDGWLVSPEVTLTLIKARQGRVTVIGAVNNPGEVNIPSDSLLDLVTAIAASGGFSEFANTKEIRLSRGDATRSFVFSKLQDAGNGPVILQNGDRIDVPVNRFANTTVTIIGEISKANAYPFPLSGILDLKTLIGTAGGVTREADLGRTTIKRGAKVMAINPNGATSLAPGDIVTVPPSRFVGKTVTIVGQVNKPGPVAFALNGKMSILNAIGHAGGYRRLANEEKVTVTRRSGERKDVYSLNLKKMSRGDVAVFYLVPSDVISVPERRF